MLLRKCDDPHAQGMMVITFLFRGEFTPQEKEDFAKSTEKSSATTLANTYLKVFTKHRTFILTASSDEELMAWCDLIFPVLKDLMGEGAFTTAEQYAKVSIYFPSPPPPLHYLTLTLSHSTSAHTYTSSHLPTSHA